jgi:putative MATE family efflux protein
MNNTTDMTKGNVYKVILLFALPLLIGNIFQLLYSLVDTIIATKFIGDIAAGQIGSTSSINSLIVSFTTGMGGGASIIISRYFGKKDNDGIRKSIASIIFINIILGLIITLIVIFTTDLVFSLINVPSDIYEASKDYYIITGIGIIAMMMFNTLSGVLRALGNSRVPIYILFLCCVLNVLGDLFFIALIKMGVGGAALATLISQLISCVVLAIYIYKTYPLLRITKKDLKFDKQVYGDILSTGLSMGLMNSVFTIGGIVMSSAVNTLGSDIISGRTTGRRIVEMLLQVASSLATACSVFVSQNYGAKNLKRANEGIIKTCLVLAIWCILILFMYLLEKPLCQVISNSDNPVIIDNAVMYVKITIPFYLFEGVLVIIRNALQALNRKIVPFISSCFELAFKIIAGLVWVPNLGFIGECITEPIAWVVCCIFLTTIYIIYYKKGIFKFKEEIND